MALLDIISKPLFWSPFKNRAASSSEESVAVIDVGDIRRCGAEEANQARVQSAAESIIQIHSALLKRPHLRPCGVTNELLVNLVRICTQIHDVNTIRRILDFPGVQEMLPSLQRLSSAAEFCLESHWAEHIMGGGDQDKVLKRLMSFPYYENYEQLTRLELLAICSVGSLPSRIAFIGSGPLPLSSLCLLHLLKGDMAEVASRVHSPQEQSKPHGDVVVLNIDNNEAAVATSLSLSIKLGDRGQGMEFICTEAGSDAQDLREFDTVYIAALVGLTQAEKEEIVVRVAGRMREGAVLVVRSTWGLRTCLYPEMDMTTETIQQRLDVCLVLHPYGQVVNSIIVAKVRGEGRTTPPFHSR